MSWKPILLIDLLLNNFFLTVHGVCWKIDVITLALFLSSMMRPAGMWMRHFYLNFTSQNIWIGLIFSSLKWPSNGVVKRLNTAAAFKFFGIYKNALKKVHCEEKNIGKFALSATRQGVLWNLATLEAKRKFKTDARKQEVKKIKQSVTICKSKAGLGCDDSKQKHFNINLAS